MRITDPSDESTILWRQSLAALFIDLNIFTDHACVLFTNREMKRLHGRAEDTRRFSTNTKRHIWIRNADKRL